MPTQNHCDLAEDVIKKDNTDQYVRNSWYVKNAEKSLSMAKKVEDDGVRHSLIRDALGTYMLATRIYRSKIIFDKVQELKGLVEHNN